MRKIVVTCVGLAAITLLVLRDRSKGTETPAAEPAVFEQQSERHANAGVPPFKIAARPSRPTPLNAEALVAEPAGVTPTQVGTRPRELLRSTHRRVAATPLAALPEPDPAAQQPPELPRTTNADERALLDAARRAVQQGDAAAARAELKKHESIFFSGQLTEEREALWVLVAGLDGDAKETDERAQAFKTRFPASVFSRSVDAAMQRAADKKR